MQPQIYIQPTPLDQQINKAKVPLQLKINDLQEIINIIDGTVPLNENEEASDNDA